MTVGHPWIELPVPLEGRLDKPAILLAAFDCSPAPVSIFRKALPDLPVCRIELALRQLNAEADA